MHIRWRGLELPSIVDCDAKTLTSTYGKFTAEPFERGFGVTIGNSLRRILLSSLEGSAVTQIKIRGAQHEFTTIPGVLEDMTDLVLNVKSLVVKNHSDSTRVITVEKSEPGLVTGADVGFAQDMDGDRLAVVDETGRPIGEELTLVLAADEVLRRAKGPVVANLATTDSVDAMAARHGCPVFRTRVGEVNVIDVAGRPGRRFRSLQRDLLVNDLPQGIELLACHSPSRSEVKPVIRPLVRYLACYGRSLSHFRSASQAVPAGVPHLRPRGRAILAGAGSPGSVEAGRGRRQHRASGSRRRAGR